MTVVEAVKNVLADKRICTVKEIYEEILARNLYSFVSKTPLSVVGSTIRRHCLGFEETAYNTGLVKYFKIACKEGSDIKFAIIDKADNSAIITSSLSTLSPKDLSIEEKIVAEYEKYFAGVQKKLLEKIKVNSPEFFEQLIVDLLIKMGYGYGPESGVVTGGSHDGGLDGIIYEDKLGLDLIHLQAKRYATNNTIGRKEIQAFVGAMEQANKGVFITTSSFSKEAKEYAVRQQKRIRLIDGEELAKLMIDNSIGVVAEKTLQIYKTDLDYFEEE